MVSRVHSGRLSGIEIHVHATDITFAVVRSFSTSCGSTDNFPRVTIFIALKYAPLLNFLFQRGEGLVQTFRVGQFEITLYENSEVLDFSGTL